MKEIEKASENKLLDCRQLAQVLGVHSRTVLRMADRGQIPFFRVGSKVIRFNLARVLEAIEEFGDLDDQFNGEFDDGHDEAMVG